MNKEKEKRAIGYLKTFEPEDEPYWLCYSGGKDSDTVRILGELAGVKCECKHNLTTVDAPETVRYIRETIGKENIILPDETMWELIVRQKIPPTRLNRYCCAVLKEQGGKGRLKITGVRWEESRKRKENAGIIKVIGKPKTRAKEAVENGVKFRISTQGGLILLSDNAKERRFVEMCYRTSNTTLNPIVDWTDEDVWEFLRYYGCESNPLYACGNKRIGCIGCPMSSNRKRELEHYPTYKSAYIRAFDKMIQERKRCGLMVDERWKDGKSVMKWWVGDDPTQITIDEWVSMRGARNETD